MSRPVSDGYRFNCNWRADAPLAGEHYCVRRNRAAHDSAVSGYGQGHPRLCDVHQPSGRGVPCRAAGLRPVVFIRRGSDGSGCR